MEKEIHSSANTESELSLALTKAAEQVVVGARYMHYKGLSYRVLALALSEEDCEPIVVYQAEYGERIIWARTVEDWLKEINIVDKKVKRFTKIADMDD